MKRLQKLKEAIQASLGFKPEKLELSFDELHTKALFKPSATGVSLYECRYSGLIEVFDLSLQEHLYLNIVLADWFRTNADTDENWSASAEIISDKLVNLEIEVRLKEEIHLTLDPAGVIERSGVRFSISDTPVQEGI